MLIKFLNTLSRFLQVKIRSQGIQQYVVNFSCIQHPNVPLQHFFFSVCLFFHERVQIYLYINPKVSQQFKFFFAHEIEISCIYDSYSKYNKSLVIFRHEVTENIFFRHFLLQLIVIIIFLHYNNFIIVNEYLLN